MSADLLPAIRASIIGSAGITTDLPAYAASYPVFTRHPVPDDAPQPLIIVGPAIQSGRADGIADQRPILAHDVSIYGRNGVAGTEDHYRTVERLARAVQQLFHRRPATVEVSGWDTIDVEALGPVSAPVDDEQTVGRRVTLTIRLARAGL